MNDKDTETKKISSSDAGETKTRESSVINTPYDDAFRTLLVDCLHLIIPVINEVFGKHYTGKEKIVLHQNVHFINYGNGVEEKRTNDSAFTVSAILEENYLIECQARPDSSILIRIFEYAAQDALDSSTLDGNNLIVTIPHVALLYLRSNKNTPNEMFIQINTPGGTVKFSVPVIKVQNYTLDELFEKHLYFLVPFYIFTHENDLSSYNDSSVKLDALKSEYVNIMEQLEKAVSEEIISVYECVTITDMTKRVLDAIAVKYQKVREGVNAVMGGKVLEHQAKTIFNAGKKEGMEAGKKEGMEAGMEAGMKAGMEAGMEAGKKSTAINLHQMGMPEGDIAKAVAESVQLVKQWLSAPQVGNAL